MILPKDRKRDRLKKWMRKSQIPAVFNPFESESSSSASSSSSAKTSKDDNDINKKNNKTRRISFLEGVTGLIKIRVNKGINLAVRDVHRRSSDPYIVVKMGQQVLKTGFVKKDLNPVWGDELTFFITDPTLSFSLTVKDHDTFSKDDPMGNAEFSIKEFYEYTKRKDLNNLSNGTVLGTEVPNRKHNCLAKESCVVWQDGHLTQDMCLRLQDVECGEVELQLRWINFPFTTQR